MFSHICSRKFKLKVQFRQFFSVSGLPIRNAVAGSDVYHILNLHSSSWNMFILTICVWVLAFIVSCNVVNSQAADENEQITDVHRILFEKFVPLDNMHHERDFVAKDNKCHPCLQAYSQCNSLHEVCPLYYDPVCGCDGHTYGNKCFATVIHCNRCFKKGACPNPPPPEESGHGFSSPVDWVPQ